MASDTGTAVVDFGAYPGANEASVTILSAGISATSRVEAFFMSHAASTDHTANDHAYVGVFCKPTCSSITAGVSFDIKAVSSEKLTGEWNIEWVWAD